MCPDGKTLSAFADGELTPKEMREVESHLGECGQCKRLLASYKRLGSVLRDTSEVAYNLSESRRRTDAVLSGARRRHIPFWRKQVRFSFAAAVAAAAFLLGGGVSLTLVMSRGSGIEFASEQPKPLDVTINVNDVRQLFQILNSQQAIREVTIQLPETQQFEFRGEPVFLRAAEYSKGVFR